MDPKVTKEAPSTNEAQGGDKMIREAVAVFHDHKTFQAAVDDLLNAGFDYRDISLLAGEQAVEQKLGRYYEKISDLEDDPDVPRVAYADRDSLVEGRAALVGGLGYIGAVAAAGAIVATGGTLAVAIAGAVIAGGSGGLIGTLGARWLGRDRAKDVQAQLEKGGLLLWVRVRDNVCERRAIQILTRLSADDVHVHELPASKDPEGAPWQDFSPDPFLPGAKI
jgi:hypothetical protein